MEKFLLPGDFLEYWQKLRQRYDSILLKRDLKLQKCFVYP